MLLSVLKSVGLELVTVILVSSVKTGLDLLFIMCKSIVHDVRLVLGMNILE